MPSESHSPLLIGNWEVLPDRHVVCRWGDERALEPRLMAVLMYLAERPQNVVSRKELLSAVWGETFVQEEALTQAISQLRRVLEDDPRSPTIISTIPKQGYRLIATVQPLAEDESVASEANPRSLPIKAILVPLFLVGLLVAAIWWGQQRGAANSPVFGAEIPLTTLPGDEAFPALSPDGKWVVFSWQTETDSGLKLHLKKIGSEKLTSLTDEPGSEYYARWSPDGERIAFGRSNERGRFICIVAAIGGPVQELSSAYWLLGGLDWSPDGEWLVFSAKDKQEAPMRLMRLRLSDSKIDTLTLPEQLARGDSYPKYSPDGVHIAFVRGDRGSSRDVFVVPASGGEAKRLTNGFYSCGGLDWQSDGEAIVLSATMRGPYELWQVPFKGGAPVLLPTKGQRALHPAISRDSGSLVYVESMLNTDVRLGSLGADEEPVAVTPSTRRDMSGRLSPDGRSLVFVSDRSGTRQLWLFDRQQNEVRMVTDLVGDALQKPRWSPDGRHVAFSIAREGLMQVVVVDASTGIERQITPGNGHYRLGHWSADGQWVFYSRENGPIWQISKVRPDGSGSVDLPNEGCLSLYERSDGGLYYFKETADGLFYQGPDGDEILAVPHSNLESMNNLELTDAGYWHIRRTEDGYALAFYNFQTASVENRVALIGDPTGELHMSPDGQSFVYTVVTETKNDLSLLPLASALK